jgi:hypothetical protein
MPRSWCSRFSTIRRRDGLSDGRLDCRRLDDRQRGGLDGRSGSRFRCGCLDGRRHGAGGIRFLDALDRRDIGHGGQSAIILWKG